MFRHSKKLFSTKLTLKDVVILCSSIVVASLYQYFMTPYFKNAIYFSFFPVLFFVPFVTGSLIAGVLSVIGSAGAVLLFFDAHLLGDATLAKTSWMLMAHFIAIGLAINFFQVLAAKRAELIKEQEKDFQTIVDHFPSLVGYWDKELKNRFSNKACTRFFGKTREQIYGMKMRDVLGNELYLPFEPEVQAALQGMQRQFSRRVKTPMGEELDLLIDCVPDERNGEVQGVFVMVQDVTSMRKAEREKSEIAQKLIHSEKMSSLGKMASGIAHEINNPLAIISGKVQVQLKKLELGQSTTEEMTSELVKVNVTTQRIARIVRGLRSFSRNTTQDPLKVMPISTIIDEALSLCEDRIKSHQIQIRTLLNEEFRVLCHPEQLEQVIINLVSNSCDAVHGIPDPWIELRVFSRDPKSFCMSVADSGPGIAPEVVARMMEPFYTTKSSSRGTGLGLSLSKEIVDQHRGKFYYDEASKNTCFIVELPKAE